MKKILFFLIVSLSFGMGACSDDDNNNENDFDIPELTESNSIQYTFSPNSKLETSIGAAGNNIAIDWGDGTVDKCKSMPNATNFSHTYAASGTYRIKIYSEGVTHLSIFEWGGTFTKLSMGQCPAITSLRIEGQKDITSLKLENSPKLTSFVIIECENLTSLDLSKCEMLQEAECVNNKLTSLNVSGCRDMETLLCSQNQLTNLDLKNNTRLKHLNCDRNKLKSLDIMGIRTLQTLNCYQNALEELNVSFASNLQVLACGFNELAELDVRTNTALVYLMCANNKISNLQMAASTQILEMFCGTNQLEANSLNSIFSALPKHQEEKNKTDHEHGDGLYSIQIKNNPGEATCDIELIKSKGWTIINEEMTPRSLALFQTAYNNIDKKSSVRN